MDLQEHLVHAVLQAQKGIHEHLKKSHQDSSAHHNEMANAHTAMLGKHEEKSDEHEFHKSAAESHVDARDDCDERVEECNKAISECEKAATSSMNKLLATDPAMQAYMKRLVDEAIGNTVQPTHISAVAPPKPGLTAVPRFGSPAVPAPIVEERFAHLVEIDDAENAPSAS
jgi:hypothetical protein